MDDDGNVAESDIFYNAFHKWGTLTDCDSEKRFDVAGVGTHEVGHVVGLDHLSDPGAFATMYPSATKGKIRKRTLTDGDKSSYTGN